MVDEMCIIVMERNNKKYREKEKRREKEKKRQKEFEKDMREMFEEEDGEVW